MQSTDFYGFPVSQLVMGTAQFGPSYGISNGMGQLSYREILALVEDAVSGGVTAFDTAPGYGDAQGMLGQALSELRCFDGAFVIGKVPAYSPTQDWAVTVVASLEVLRLEALPLCLLHRASDLCYFDELLLLREQGLICQAGVSVYTPEEALLAMAQEGVSAIQLPTSLLDHRFLKQDVFRRAAEAQIAVFVRSAFLQGAICLGPDALPRNLLRLENTLKILKQLAGSSGLKSMALKFARAVPDVTGIVVGMETREQLAENLETFREELEVDLVRELEQLVPALPEELLDPRHWS